MTRQASVLFPFARFFAQRGGDSGPQPVRAIDPGAQIATEHCRDPGILAGSGDCREPDVRRGPGFGLLRRTGICLRPSVEKGAAFPHAQSTTPGSASLRAQLASNRRWNPNARTPVTPGSHGRRGPGDIPRTRKTPLAPETRPRAAEPRESRDGRNGTGSVAMQATVESADAAGNGAEPGRARETVPGAGIPAQEPRSTPSCTSSWRFTRARTPP